MGLSSHWAANVSSGNPSTAVRLDKSEVAPPSGDSKLFVPLAEWALSCQKPRHLVRRVWESVKCICMPRCWKNGRSGGGELPDSAFAIGEALVHDRRMSTMHSELHRRHYLSHLQLLLIFASPAHVKCTTDRDSCTATMCRRHGGAAQAPRSTIA